MQKPTLESALELIARAHQGKTILQTLRHEFPVRVGKVFHPHGPNLAVCYLLNPTAGIFGGDRIQLKLRICSGAALVLIAPAYTQVHPKEEQVAEWSCHVELEENAEFHYYNEPLIPFSNSRTKTSLEVNLEPSSCFVGWEAIMAGRQQSGEAWQFASLENSIRIRSQQKLIYQERYRIIPNQHPPQANWQAGRHNYLATGLFHTPQAPSDVAGNEHGSFQKSHSSHEPQPPTPNTESGYSMVTPQLQVGRFLAQRGHGYQSLRQDWMKRLWTEGLQRAPLDLRKY